MSMKPIPASAAREIAEGYGYHQVIIIARRIGKGEDGGEHVITAGVNTTHTAIAAAIGQFFRHRLTGWPRDDDAMESRVAELLARALEENGT